MLVDGKRYTSPNQALRKIFNLYANIRPSKSLPNVSPYQNVDLVVVRENTECLYTGQEQSVGDDVVEATRRISRKASTRIAEFAFKLAQDQHYSRVTAVHKANVLKLSDGLFLDSVRQVAKSSRYSDVKLNEVLADSLLTSLVLDPSKFQVLLCTNMFGDLVSDLAGGLIGSLGLCPSGQYGESHALFEPAHGSAPDIAGKGIVNPTSQILSGVMMLRHLGFLEQAARIERSVHLVLSSGQPSQRTPDIGGTGTTQSFTDAIITQMNNE